MRNRYSQKPHRPVLFSCVIVAAVGVDVSPRNRSTKILSCCRDGKDGQEERNPKMGRPSLSRGQGCQVQAQVVCKSSRGTANAPTHFAASPRAILRPRSSREEGVIKTCIHPVCEWMPGLRLWQCCANRMCPGEISPNLKSPKAKGKT